MTSGNGERKHRTSWRRSADELHGTVVRYAGVALLVYAGAFDRFKNPALLPAAMGMIFYKNVVGKGE